MPGIQVNGAYAPGPLPKRILLVHNRYKLAGGEDSVFESEKRLLESMGHEVDALEFSNHETDAMPKWKAAAEAVWSGTAKRALESKLRDFAPDVVHFHNTFLRVSPAAYYACSEAGIACVQTLHNYRLLCLNALFLRDDKPCEDCLGRRAPWPGILHRCYHGSLKDSCLVASVRMAHNLLGTYANKVDAFIALTDFGREKFIRGGLPAAKLHIKPNFVEDIGAGKHLGGFCLYAGRLSHEKGVRTLVEAWKRLDGDIPLKVVGSGPEEGLLQPAPPGVEWLGRIPREEVFRLMREASAVIVPSGCYEGFPVAIAEAFAAGAPVIASRLGTMAEILSAEDAGWLFDTGDPEALARTVRAAWNEPGELARRGMLARARYEAEFSPNANYTILMDIYRKAGERALARA